MYNYIIFQKEKANILKYYYIFPVKINFNIRSQCFSAYISYAKMRGANY